MHHLEFDGVEETLRNAVCQRHLLHVVRRADRNCPKVITDGVNKNVSKEIMKVTGRFIPVGSGELKVKEKKIAQYYHFIQYGF